MRERYPELTEADQEAVRQHAVAALNITQKARAVAGDGDEEGEKPGSTAFIDSVRKYAMDVKRNSI